MIRDMTAPATPFDTSLSASLGTSPGLAPAARRAAVRGRSAALAWGGLGFLVGAVFWHFVGFWSFISEVVFKGRHDAEPTAVVRKNDVKAAALKKLEERQMPEAACIRLVIARKGRPSHATACTVSDQPLPHPRIGAAPRGDLAVHSPGSWTTIAKRDD
jgi:hypothetical protein